MQPDLIGRSLGAYTIRSLIGRGGMGAVYLAEDEGLGRKVAVKLLPEDAALEAGSRRRFMQEARTLAQLDHPHICPIYDVGREAGLPFIVMQYVEGRSLSDWLARESPPLEARLEIVAQVLEALGEAHAKGIVHRDLKPQNIMVTRRGDAKVLDFGLAKALGEALRGSDEDTHSALTRVGVILGTVPYMSPEQAIGQNVDHRSDLFSVGTLLYESLTGKRPFAGDTDIDTRAEILDRDPPPPSSLNPELPNVFDEVVRKALGKRPGDRYQSAGEMLGALRAAQAELAADTGQRQTMSAQRGLRLWRRAGKLVARHPFYVALLLIAVAAAVLLPNLRSHQAVDERAERNYRAGVEALRNAAYYQAARLLEHAVEADSSLPLAHARLAEAYLELDERVKAQQQLLRAHELLPNRASLARPDRLYVEALSAIASGDRTAAITRYREIAEMDPSAPEARIDLGRAYERDNQGPKALEEYRAATKLDPDNATAFLRLGIAYAREGQRDESDAAFIRADQLFRDQGNVEGRAQVHYQRGSLARRNTELRTARGELEQARDLARAAGNETTEILSLLQLSSIGFAEGSADSGEALAADALRLARERGLQHLTVSALIDVGNTLFARGDSKGAERYYAEALRTSAGFEEDFEQARARFMLGYMMISRSDVDGGLAHVQAALAFFERGGYRIQAVQAESVIGRARRDRGEYAEAAKIFTRLLDRAQAEKNTARIANAHDELGRVLYLLDDYPGARDHFEASAAIYRKLGAGLDLAFALTNLGTAQWQLGHYGLASNSFQGAQSAVSSDEYRNVSGSIRQNTAEMEITRGNFAAALAALRPLEQSSASGDLEAALQSQRLECVIETQQGTGRPGVELCRQALTAARGMRNAWLIVQAQLSLAEALLRVTAPGEALAEATGAYGAAAEAGQHAFAWRAASVAALAANREGKHDDVRQHLAQAGAELAALKKAWPLRDYESYAARPDIRQLDAQVRALATAASSSSSRDGRW